jgi:hypothetical protein
MAVGDGCGLGDVGTRSRFLRAGQAGSSLMPNALTEPAIGPMASMRSALCGSQPLLFDHGCRSSSRRAGRSTLRPRAGQLAARSGGFGHPGVRRGHRLDTSISAPVVAASSGMLSETRTSVPTTTGMGGRAGEGTVGSSDGDRGQRWQKRFLLSSCDSGGSSSVGRARPFQGRCREFESRLSLFSVPRLHCSNLFAPRQSRRARHISARRCARPR